MTGKRILVAGSGRLLPATQSRGKLYWQPPWESNYHNPYHPYFSAVSSATSISQHSHKNFRPAR